MPDSECEGRESLQLTREGMFGAVQGRYGASCSQRSAEFSLLTAEKKSQCVSKDLKRPLTYLRTNSFFIISFYDNVQSFSFLHIHT